jgi:uncharacterized protein YjbI with pentapeptide repeats
VVSGLTNGKPYSVEVQAENSVGFGKGAVANSLKPTRAQDCAYRGPFANLQNCNLSNANLSGLDLMEANLAGAQLAGVSSGGIVGLPTGLPSGWRLLGGYLLGPTANLMDAHLAGLNLGSLNLFDANLIGVTSGQISGVPVLPTGWLLIDGYLVGPGANLTDANLSNANLANTDLDGTELSGAVLSGVSSGGVFGTPSSLPTGWMMVDGYLVGPRANLTDANLSNADLANASLAGAMLSGANLSGVSSGGITGSPSSLPTDWMIADDYLVGPGANLTNADLVDAVMTNADLDDANLAGADLDNVTSGGITGYMAVLPQDWGIVDGYLVGPGANLSSASLSQTGFRYGDLAGVNFTNANLDDSDFTNANLLGATWSNTTCPDGSNSNADGNTCANDLGFIDSDANAQQDLEESLSFINSIYAMNGGSFPSTAALVSSLVNVDPSLTFTNFSSTHPNWISVFSSPDGNGTILAAYAPVSGNCWYIYDNQGAVAVSPPYGLAPTEPSDGFVGSNGSITVTNGSGTYYAEVKNDFRSSDCSASQPVAMPLSQYTYQSIGFPEL